MLSESRDIALAVPRERRGQAQAEAVEQKTLLWAAQAPPLSCRQQKGATFALQRDAGATRQH